LNNWLVLVWTAEDKA